jgi:TetR/AcrR family transcriptional regulator
MPRPARVSPDRILAAAAIEFAERGFGGARVDRIARRARVNKAMLYYHFRNKQALYRALLRRTFTAAAERMQAIAGGAGSPADKVDRVIAGIADLIREHEFFPAIMLREVAEGGAHLDRDTLLTLAAVPRAVGGIVQHGVERGAFRDVNPLFAYFSMLAPVVFYLAAGPIRKELGALHLADVQPRAAEEFVRHMQDVMRCALARDAKAPARPTS